MVSARPPDTEAPRTGKAPPRLGYSPNIQHLSLFVRNPNETDADLVRRVREGDREAFGELVERYAEPARRVARAMLGNADDGDDAAQDGFFNALVRLEQYDEQRPFGPWVLRIVANAALDRRRRRAVRNTEPLTDQRPSRDGDPAELTDRRLMLERLEAALTDLPERQSAAVVLFDVEGYSHREIAQILGVREGTVRSDVFHARRHLRTALAPWKEKADS